MKQHVRDYIDLQVEAVEKSIAVAHAALEKRLDGMNEFRATLKDQNSTFISRPEFTTFKEHTENDVRSLRESRAELQGKASQTSVIITLLVSVSGLVLGIINILK